MVYEWCMKCHQISVSFQVYCADEKVLIVTDFWYLMMCVCDDVSYLLSTVCVLLENDCDRKGMKKKILTTVI